MPEPLVYEFQMTSEFCRTAIEPLEQVLWMQNERFYRHLESRMRFRSQLRVAGIVLAACGLALALYGWSLAPRKRTFFGGMSAAYVALLLAFVLAPAMGRALRRFARRTVSWTARRTMRRVASRTPYTILYELGEAELATRVEKLGISRVLDLRCVRVAVATPDFICVFRRPLGQRPARVLYVPGPREHAALSAALVAAGVQLLRLPSG
jgi:hypothetical protein